MPIFLKVGAFRFYITSFDCNEPPHIHVSKDRKEAKYWLQKTGVKLADNKGFTLTEIFNIEKVILENINLLKVKWHEYCKEEKPKQYK
jgi:hypothetical protein